MIQKSTVEIHKIFNRSYRDSNSDGWIQSPKCLPLHHKTTHLYFYFRIFYYDNCCIKKIFAFYQSKHLPNKLSSRL